jgi:hypothetical protein
LHHGFFILTLNLLALGLHLGSLAFGITEIKQTRATYNTTAHYINFLNER